MFLFVHIIILLGIIIVSCLYRFFLKKKKKNSRQSCVNPKRNLKAQNPSQAQKPKPIHSLALNATQIIYIHHLAVGNAHITE